MYVYGHHKIKETEQGYELIVYGVKPSVFNEEKRFTFDVYLDRSVLRINNIYRIYPEGTITGDENWIRYEKLYWLRGTRMTDKEAVEKIISLMEIDRYVLPYDFVIYETSIDFNFEECTSLIDFSNRKRKADYLCTFFFLIEDIEDIYITMHLNDERIESWMPKTIKSDNKTEVKSLIADNPKILENILRTY